MVKPNDVAIFAAVLALMALIGHFRIGGGGSSSRRPQQQPAADVVVEVERRRASHKGAKTPHATRKKSDNKHQDFHDLDLDSNPIMLLEWHDTVEPFPKRMIHKPRRPRDEPLGAVGALETPMVLLPMTIYCKHLPKTREERAVENREDPYVPSDRRHRGHKLLASDGEDDDNEEEFEDEDEADGDGYSHRVTVSLNRRRHRTRGRGLGQQKKGWRFRSKDGRPKAKSSRSVTVWVPFIVDTSAPETSFGHHTIEALQLVDCHRIKVNDHDLASIIRSGERHPTDINVLGNDVLAHGSLNVDYRKREAEVKTYSRGQQLDN